MWVLLRWAFALGLGKSRLPFKISSHFLLSSGAMLGPPISWISWGFVPLFSLILSPDFSRLDSFPSWSPLWLLLHMPQISASSSYFYCAYAQQRNFPPKQVRACGPRGCTSTGRSHLILDEPVHMVFIPSPCNPFVPWEDGLFACLGLWPRMCLSPWVSVKL